MVMVNMVNVGRYIYHPWMIFGSSKLVDGRFVGSHAVGKSIWGPSDMTLVRYSLHKGCCCRKLKVVGTVSFAMPIVRCLETKIGNDRTGQQMLAFFYAFVTFIQVQTCRNDLHLLFMPSEKKRLSLVAVDVGMAREKGLEAAKLVYNKRLAKNFLCSRPGKLDFNYRKQETSIAVTPMSQTETAEVALCLIKESDTLGSAMWTLLDFEVVQVCRTAPVSQAEPKSKEDPWFFAFKW